MSKKDEVMFFDKQGSEDAVLANIARVPLPKVGDTAYVYRFNQGIVIKARVFVTRMIPAIDANKAPQFIVSSGRGRPRMTVQLHDLHFA